MTLDEPNSFAQTASMSVFIILIITSVLVAGGFLIAFLWSVKSGQMDDDYTPSIRILFEDEVASKKQSNNNQTN